MATLEQQNTKPIEQDITLEASTQAFHENQRLDEDILDSETELASQVIKQGVKTEQDTLEKAVKVSGKTETLGDAVQTTGQTLEQEVSTSPITLYNQEIQNIDAIRDNENLQNMANIRITKCKDLLTGLKGNMKSKNELKRKVNRAIKTDLMPMTKDEHIYETGFNEYKNRLKKIIYDYYTNREPARQIIMMGGRVPVINGTADTKAEAKSDQKSAKNNAERWIDFSEIKKNTALYTLIGVSASEWGNYCDYIAQGGIAVQHPVFVQHTIGFNNVRAYNPDLYRALTPAGQISYDTYCQRNPQCRLQCKSSYNPNRRYRTGTIGDDIASMIEDSQRRRGKEVNPQQREALRKLGNIGSVVGCIALGFGIIREIFHGKDKKTNRWKVLGLGAGIYGITHYKDVKNLIFDATNFDPDNWVAKRQAEHASEQMQATTGLSSSEATEVVNAKITYPTLVATTIGIIPIKQLIEQKIVEEKNGKLVLNKANYAVYVETMALALGRSDKDKKAMLDKLATNEAAEAISNGLAYCGINTLNDLNNLKGSSDTSTLMDSATFTTKYKMQIEVITKQTGIFSNMEKQGLIPAGLDQTIKILENYDSNKNENEQILGRLKAGLLTTSSDKKYEVEDMVNGSYSQCLDLENMTMKLFTNGANEVKFSSYGELFEAVYITEWIKRNFAGRTDAKDAVPFHTNVEGAIEFNNTEWYEIHKNETKVISLKKLRKELPTIKNNRDAYNEYLNKWRVGQL